MRWTQAPLIKNGATGIFIVALLLVMGNDGIITTRTHLTDAKASIGSEDDPQARVLYEWMMLHDPTTGRIPPNIRAQELAFAATLPTKESLVSAGLTKSDAASSIQLLTWSRRGPVNVGGRTRALAVDVGNANILLAGGVSGGMWRSTNSGASWTKTTAPSALHSVVCLAQDIRTGNQGTWYYGTGEYRGNSAGQIGAPDPYLGDGIFKSTDGGITWAVLPSTVSGTPQSFEGDFDITWNIVTNPSNLAQSELYAAVYGGIKRSVDGGTSWTTALGNLANGKFVDVAITSAGVLYAALSSDATTNKGIWRSTDGTNWTDITPASWPSVHNRTVIGIALSNQNMGYFLGETPGSGKNDHSFWKYTYVSGDGSGAGGTWEDRSANLPAYGGKVGTFDSQGSYDLVVKTKPDNANVVFIGGSNLYRSTNGFADTLATAWVGGYSPANDISQYPQHHPDQHALAFRPGSPSTLYSGHDGGISVTSDDVDAIVWTFLNNGYITSQFYTIAIDHATSGNNVIIGGLQDNGSWFVNSASSTAAWVTLPGGGDGSACAIADGRSSYYASVQNGRAFRLLLDGTGTATGFTRVDPTGGTGYLFNNPYVLDPSNTDIMYLAGGSSLWQNIDLTAIPLGSNNTTSVNWTDLTNAGVTGSIITALGVSRSSPQSRLYYGTNDGRVLRLDGANSATSATAPVDVSTGMGFPPGAYVSCIAVDPGNGDKAMVVFSNYSIISLYYTTNGGSGWTAVSGNLEQNPDGTGNGPSIRWASILPFGGTTYYFLGTSTGLYSTKTLNGTNTVWAQEGASTIGNVVVTMIDSRGSDGLVVIGTHGVGAFSSSVATGVSESNAVPTKAALYQNYPNPFNPSTTIRFSVSRPGFVTLKVYSIAGHEVATLVSEQRNAGEYTVQWTPAKIASGMYICRMQSAGFAESRKFLLVR